MSRNWYARVGQTGGPAFFLTFSQFLASRGTPPGKASGIVYGVSTLGNIAGVMLTAFALIPHFRVSTLLYLWLGVAIVSLASLVRLLRVPASS